ncbi:MAG: DUF2913 family protein [Psychrobium sp.]
MESPLLFKEHLALLTTTALTELAKSSANDPVSESHYLSLWVTQAIKNKRFDLCMSPLLKQWQQSARTLGQGANLKHQFESIKHDYQHVDNLGETITKDSLLTLFNVIEAADWQVNYQHLGRKKVAIKMLSSSSLVVDNESFEKAFDENGLLVNQINLFIRGNNKHFFKAAYDCGMLCFKLSDYKSVVKFHGQYVIAANNNYASIAEFSSDF